MKDKYIGNKRPSVNSKGSNFGLIFEKQPDGTYICPTALRWDNTPFVLTEEEIKHDIKLNYLLPYGE